MKKHILERYQMTNKSIKVITFDLDDTFWDITPVIIKAEIETRKWVEKQLDSNIEWGSLEDFINLRKKLIAENYTLEYDLSALRKASLKYHVERFFENKTDLDNFVNEAFVIFFNYRQQVKLFAGVKKFLKKMSAEIDLGILTNGNADIKLIGIDKFFKCSISSKDVYSNKPDPKHFEEAARFFNVNINQILHIGDDPINDVRGALDAGAHAIWFNKKCLVWNETTAMPVVIDDWEKGYIKIKKHYEF